MKEKNSKKKQSTITKQTDLSSLYTAFDFLKSFLYWKKIILHEYAFHALTFYYHINKALDNEGNIRDDYEQKFISMKKSFSEKSSSKKVLTLAQWVNLEDFDDPDILLKLSVYCLLIPTITNHKITNEEDIKTIINCDCLALTTINRALGYWMAKQASKNPGAEAMKKRYSNNNKVINELIEKMSISDTGIFRTDKDKRKIFFDQAKEKTSLTSEDRIFRITRDNLKKKKSKI